MIFNNDFTCPDGHAFKANAKLRARCPTCGKMARRAFKDIKVPAIAEPSNEPEPKEPIIKEPEPPAPIAKVTVLKRGRPKITMAPAKKPVTKKAPPKRAPISTKAITSGTKLVKRSTLKGVVKPKMTGKPKRTATARHISMPNKSYRDEMIDRYGF